MKERVADARRPGRAPHVGVDVPLRVLADPAPRGARCSATGRRSRSTTRPTPSRLTDYVRRDLNLDPKRFPPRRLHGAISALKNELVAARAGAATGVHPAREAARRGLHASTSGGSRDASAVDFDDLLVLAVRLFREHPDALRALAAAGSTTCSSTSSRTPTLAQWELVRLLTEEHRNVMVVGDADQCLVAGTQVTMGDGSRRPIEQVARRRRRAVVLRQRRLPPAPVSCACTASTRSERHRDHDSRAAAASCPPPTTSTSPAPRRAAPCHASNCGADARRSVRRATRDDVRTDSTSADAPSPSSVRTGHGRWSTSDGEFDLVDVRSSGSRLDRAGLRPRHRADAQLRRRTASSRTTRSTSSAGRTSGTCMRFEEAFPDATVIVLDQNYRSTQRILDAANAVIANNAARRPKHLWTEQVGGELIVRYHAEDEHDEAAFVVHEIDRLVDTEEHRFGDIAVFYRTNAQSRVIEETLVRAGVPYRVVGGVKFYDRREVKDALAYLRALVNPDDEVSWKRIVNTPQARRRRHVGAPRSTRTRRARRSRSATRSRDAAAAGVTGKALGGIRDLLELMDDVRARRGRRRRRRRVEAILEQHRLPRRARGRAHRSRRRAGSRTCRSSSASAASSTSSSTRGDLSGLPGDRRRRHRRPRRGEVDDPDGLGPRAGVPRGDLARHRPRRRPIPTTSTVTLMTLHSAKGLEYPGRVPHRARGRHVPARAQPRRSRRARGGTPALLRRHHPRPRAALPLPRVEPHAVRRHRLLPAEPVPRRDPRGARRTRIGERATRRGRDAGFGAHRDAVVARGGASAARGRERPRRRRPARAAPSSSGCASATTSRHEKFGEGVILDVDRQRRQGRGRRALPRRRREAPAARLGAAPEDRHLSGRVAQSARARGSSRCAGRRTGCPCARPRGSIASPRSGRARRSRCRSPLQSTKRVDRVLATCTRQSFGAGQHGRRARRSRRPRGRTGCCGRRRTGRAT